MAPTRRPCLGPTPGTPCPTGTLIQPGTRGGRCANCARTTDQARGTRQARGYDANHDRERRRWQQRLDAGETIICWRCAETGTPHKINPNHWDLGHDDHNRNTYRGPECPAGNRATAGRRPT